jgi:hypothetical protein
MLCKKIKVACTHANILYISLSLLLEDESVRDPRAGGTSCAPLDCGEEALLDVKRSERLVSLVAP